AMAGYEITMNSSATPRAGRQITGEADNIRRLVPAGAERYYLLTSTAARRRLDAESQRPWAPIIW
ncbi:MAG TPA: hypothetical protein VFI46_06080, partial [Jiangellaceae bacterium]|nr:hypothetical protein [Jiangellaceae bacterium]